MAKKGYNPCTAEEKKIMIEAYQSGLSLRKAAAKVGRTDLACSGALREAGIPTRTLSVSHQQYEADYHFFDRIDSEEKAYWFGFIIADGTIQRNDISIRLAEKDLDHIEKFQKAIKSNHPIHQYFSHVQGKDYPYRRLVVCSEHMRKTLNRYGFKKKFEYIGAPTEFFEKNLHRHFWRGIFDGDGSIGYGERSWVVDITSHPQIVRDFYSFLLEHTFTEAKIENRGEYSRFRVSGNLVAKAAAAILYHKATVYMDRKKESADLAMLAPIGKYSENADRVTKILTNLAESSL